MKKFLRFVLILLIVITVGVLILGLIAPREMTMERVVTINAPAATVKEQMLQFRNFKNWSPWQELDSNMKSEVAGPELTPGTRYIWDGNSDVGKGEIVLNAASGSEVQYTILFKEPWESKAGGYWKVEDAGNGQSKALWGFSSGSPYPWNGLAMVMGMEKMLAKDLDKGLNRLKIYSEEHAQDAHPAAWTIETVQFPGYNYAAIRKTIRSDMPSLMKFFDESYNALGKSAGNRIAGSASSLVYHWDDAAGKADIAAAFPVSGENAVNGVNMVKVGAAAAYKVVYTGGYHGSSLAHEAIGEKLAVEKKEYSLIIEEYVKGPGEEKDSTHWVTNIYYLLK